MSKLSTRWSSLYVTLLFGVVIALDWVVGRLTRRQAPPDDWYNA